MHASVARSTFRSQKREKLTVSDHFWTLISVLRGGCKGFGALPKVSKAQCKGFVAVSKMLAGAAHLKRVCKDPFRVASAVQETCSSKMLGGQDANF